MPLSLPSLPEGLTSLPSGAAGTEIIQSVRNQGRADQAELMERHENRLNGAASSVAALRDYLQSVSIPIHDLIPELTDTYDLGTSALRWRNAYIDFFPSIPVGQVGYGNILYPTTDLGFALGKTANRWGELHVNIAFEDFIVAPSGTVALNGNLIPNTDHAYNLGSSGNSWKELYVYHIIQAGAASSLLVDAQVVPGINDTYDLGSATNAWRQIFIYKLSNIAGQAIQLLSSIEGDIKPSVTANYNLGSASFQFQNGWIHTLVTDTLAGNSSGPIACNATFKPFLSNTFDLGDSSHRWGKLFINSFDFAVWPVFTTTISGVTFTLNSRISSYIQLGNIVFVQYVINITVTVGGSPIQLTLPVNAVSTAGYDQSLSAFCGETGDPCGAIIFAATPGSVFLYGPSAAGNSFNPGTYAIWCNGSYQSA